MSATYIQTARFLQYTYYCDKTRTQMALAFLGTCKLRLTVVPMLISMRSWHIMLLFPAY